MPVDGKPMPFQWPESKLIGMDGRNGDTGMIKLNPELCGVG